MERSDSRDLYNFVRASSDQSSTLFDASQYDFFGKSLDEMSLGGFEDDEVIAPVLGHADDDEYHLFDKGEGGGLGSLSELDDLATTFAKLNRNVTGPKHPGVIGDRGSGSFSRESSSATDWTQDAELTSWLDEQDQEAKRWSSQPQSSAHSKPLYRTSSYPQQQPQLQHYNSEPIILPESTFTSFPPPGSRSPQASPGNLHRAPSLPGGTQLTFSGPSQLSNSSYHLSGLSHGPHYGGNLARYASCGPALGSMVQPHWVTDPGLLHGDHSGLLHSLVQQQHQQLPPRNGLMSQHLMALQQRQSYAHLATLQSQMYSSYPSPSRKVPFGVGEVREHKHKSHRSRKNRGISQQASDAASQKSESGLQFRSKYMTSEEIESILKMQHSNSHSNDPYVNDYYHQAQLAKKSAGSRAISHFYPAQLKDHQPRSRNSSEQHPQVHVDALGKITLPYIRRPRALLEVDSSPGSNDGSGEHKGSGKHLEQEPLVAARVTIEDALGVLIDVVDIDRTLQSTRPQDGGAQIKRKRQILVEGLATALQLADPFSKTGQKSGLTAKDDVVFLRIATLPKGRKMLTKYIQLLVPGTEIARVVCMAIFRHLRFLFGGLPSDTIAAETIANLAKAVTVCVQAMDLRALSACLAAVVCSSEQPPLRPIGSSAGDGASVVLISLLERAAEVVVVPRAIHGSSNDGLWRASFDEFFNLLTKYCRSKYETIRSQNQGSAADVLELAIKREMPAELLRASLRHTNDDQRNYLLNFGRKPSAISESASHARSGGQINSESVMG
uniref:Protein PAT1-like protein 1 n=1 Tax=Noccaea caerulescens TaxID=107243 RepID=A0A1J3DIU8_NOCCA